MTLSVVQFLIDYQYVILAYFLALAVVYAVTLLYAFRELVKQKNARLAAADLENLLNTVNARPVSIVIPAFNEALTITQTILSTSKVIYPEFEVVIVNDGSTDNTMEILAALLDLVQITRPVQRRLTYKKINAIYASRSHQNVIVVDKENGGKADALNAGLDVSSYPLFCSIDADSLLEPTALMRMANRFLFDREIVALGGSVRILNGCTVKDGEVVRIKAPYRLIESIQIAEYLRGFLAGRVVWNRMKSLLIISGAFGIFRKDLLHAIGGYRQTVGEDMDLVIRLHRYCVRNKMRYHVAFDPEPVCWTQAPSDFRSLLTQRNRWQRGLISALWHSRGMMLNPRYGSVGLIAFPYFVVIEMIAPFVELTGYVSMVIFFILGMVSMPFFLLFLVLAIVWGGVLNMTAVIFDSLIVRRYENLRDILEIALTSALEFLGYRQVVDFERAVGSLLAWRKSWGHPRRSIMLQDDETQVKENPKRLGNTVK
ncbi:glycosyltransferase family 2 protein [Acidithiobacillus sp. VAN18-1]|uniref:Glycosyltransferase family 2 protein n=2 Tax=Acidithiobacillaceae TaxID=225058 RepID=A0AAE2YPG5_9PROT|nr:glycosyltransferase [Igneacidithiobacillus copahuensis]MBU2787846.1 glycosyltransferase family 2 protein [Igneacidithiobacillus copahuensis]MBU2795261.1 glycosyltransferase family 2 protein [Acidithiobacillus sp. VAN18-2]